MTNFNQDLYSVVATILEKDDQQIRHHAVEPWPDQVWDQLEESGFTAVGRDAAIDDHAAIAKAVGMHAVALPLVDVGLARWIADLAGLEVPADAIVVCAGTQPLEGLQRGPGRITVTGTAPRVPWGRNADLVVVPVGLDGTLHWALVERSQLGVSESVNFACEPRDTLRFDDLVVPVTSLSSSGPSVRDVLARGALLRSASGLGAMEFALNASLAYAEQRFQFGRPISDFQTVQHHLVLIAEAVASVASAVQAAVSAPADLRLVMVAGAKVMLGEQAAILTRLAHQVHGAIGATEEHPLQPRTRRLWSWQDEYGTTTDWAIDLADQLVFPESPGAWPVMTPPLQALATRPVGEVVPW